MVVDDVLDAVGNVIHILGRDAANRDTAVLSHVNTVLLDHRFTLLNGKTCEREHTNLRCDVRPVTLHLFLLKGASKCIAHVVHPGTHDNKFVEPLLAHLWVV